MNTAQTSDIFDIYAVLLHIRALLLFEVHYRSWTHFFAACLYSCVQFMLLYIFAKVLHKIFLGKNVELTYDESASQLLAVTVVLVKLCFYLSL